MHPTLARYLDPQLVHDVLAKAEAGNDPGPDHRHLLEAAKAYSPERRAVLRAKNKRLDETAQQAALFLATHAALRALREDPAFAEPLTRASDHLREDDADDAEIDATLAQLVADEAFGTDEDPGEFDRAWFDESLKTLPALLALNEAQVSDLLQSFAGEPKAPDRHLRNQVAQTLLEAAWGEGASPISVEHVEDALDALGEDFGEDAFPKAALTLAEFVERLQQEGLVGPLRAQRLAATARHAAAVSEGAGEA